MKVLNRIFNRYLDLNYIDFLVWIILLSFIIYFDIDRRIDIDDNTNLYNNILTIAVSVWTFGVLSATVLVSTTPDRNFELLLSQLGIGILKSVFTALSYLLISMGVILLLHIKQIQDLQNLEIALFIFSVILIVGNSIRFSITLYRILKVRLL